MEKIGGHIYRIEGRKPGPHLMVLGGVHGNERTGVQAVRWLRDRFGKEGEKLMRGTLTVALGNPVAVRRNTRGSAPHRDLNRCFRPEILASPATYEAHRAAEIAPFIAEADFLVDLHAVNTPSEPFAVATAHDRERERLAANFPCGIFLVAPDDVIGGTTDGWAARTGGVGIGYESGYVKDLSRMEEVKTGVDGIMKAFGLLGRGQTLRGLTPSQSVIQLEEPLLLEGEGFTFAPGRGRMSFEPVRKGDLLGHMDERPVRAPFTGLLVFPKPKCLQYPNMPVGFLAVKKKTAPIMRER